MESEEDEIKSKQASKKDRTLMVRNRQNFYKDFPEPSGGATIVSNKCRVTQLLLENKDIF
jgi:hypothetical protein